MTLPPLRDHLAAHTKTPDVCWFALWAGFGYAPERWRNSHTFRLPGRQYWLFGGTLTDVVDLSIEFDSGGSEADVREACKRMGIVHTPTTWWPEDHVWLVHSDIDYDSTLVGGTPMLIEALVSDPRIEALQTDPDTCLYANGDTVNGNHPSD